VIAVGVDPRNDGLLCVDGDQMQQLPAVKSRKRGCTRLFGVVDARRQSM
jgi:hypothetical protein